MSHESLVRDGRNGRKIMSYLLAFDTSTEKLGLGLWHNHAEVAIQESQSAGKHTESLVPSIQSFLKERRVTYNQLAAVACARGPGSFTGLRVGLATAKGLAVALRIPFISVPTLEGLAASYELAAGFVSPDTPAPPLPSVLVPVIDARKRRFYAQVFRWREEYTPVSDPVDETPANIANRARETPAPTVSEHLSIGIVGPGAMLFEERLNSQDSDAADPGSIVYSDAPTTAARGIGFLATRRLTAGTVDPSGQGLLYVRAGDIGTKRAVRQFDLA